MRLRKECEHGRYDEHDYWLPVELAPSLLMSCDGGEFLADDAVVIERLDDRELWRGVKRFIQRWHDDEDILGREGAG